MNFDVILSQVQELSSVNFKFEEEWTKDYFIDKVSSPPYRLYEINETE